MKFLLIMPGGWELVMIVIVLILFFGGNKIPGFLRNIGNGIIEFKKGVKNLKL